MPCPRFPTRADAVKVPSTMPKTKRENEPPVIIELLLPLAGLLLMAVFLMPGFRELLGTLLFVSLGFVALSLVVGMWLYFRHLKQLAEANPPGAAPAVPEASGDTWTIELLGRLEWKRFEELVAAYSHELGYTARSADGPASSRAVVLCKNGRTEPAMLLQCRRWDAVTVGVAPVRELSDAMTALHVGYGAYYTPGEFTAEAEEFARGKILDLVTGREFLHRLRQLSPPVQQKLLEEATVGDYTSPTCPGCDIKMVPLTDGSKPAAGGHAWVCRNAPQCQRTLQVA